MTKLPKGALENISFSELKNLKKENGENLRSIINQVIDSFGGIINQENINDFKELLSNESLKYKITSQIIILYIDFLNDIKNIVENHNKIFFNNETISESIEKGLSKLLLLIESTGPIITILSELNIDIAYIKTLDEVNSKNDFEQKLLSDGKDINKLTPRQKEILYGNFNMRLKPLLSELKDKHSEIYNNIEKYLNGNTEDTIRKITNKKRFDEVIKSSGLSYEGYIEKLHIEENQFLETEIDLNMINTFTRLNNLFIKRDSTNALAMFDTTKEPNGEIIQDNSMSETTIFQKIDRGLKPRKGYNIIQGASENMLTQAIQKRLLKFNDDMEKILTERK